MSHELVGRVALVTGASKGIGAGVATAFGAAGASVAVGFARDKEGADRVVGEIEAAGGRASAVQGDLSKADDVEASVGKVVAALARSISWSTMAPCSISKRCRTSMRRISAPSIPMCSAC